MQTPRINESVRNGRGVCGNGHRDHHGPCPACQRLAQEKAFRSLNEAVAARLRWDQICQGAWRHRLPTL